MSRLFVVVGYPDTKPTSEPIAVYVGSSGDGMRSAMAKSSAARFIVLANPLGIRKNNPNAAANGAAATAAAEEEPDLLATIEHLTAQKDELQKLVGLAEAAIKGSDERAEGLSRELVDLTERVRLTSVAFARDMSALTEQLNAAQREASDAQAELARVQAAPAVVEAALAETPAPEPVPPTPVPAPTGRRRGS